MDFKLLVNKASGSQQRLYVYGVRAFVPFGVLFGSCFAKEVSSGQTKRLGCG